MAPGQPRQGGGEVAGGQLGASTDLAPDTGNIVRSGHGHPTPKPHPKTCQTSINVIGLKI